MRGLDNIKLDVKKRSCDRVSGVEMAQPHYVHR